jgi:glycerol transport system ATP-binding protein
MLLDEPLVNLDYKLREELRDELSALFAAGDSTVVYATTEPTEALLLGGYTAVLDAGELLQYGPTAEVFHRPCSIRVARAFSDPPMNLVRPGRGRAACTCPTARLDLALPPGCGANGQAVTVGVRAGALRVQPRPGDVPARQRRAGRDLGLGQLRARATPIGELVSQLPGVHVFTLGSQSPCT